MPARKLFAWLSIAISLALMFACSGGDPPSPTESLGVGGTGTGGRSGGGRGGMSAGGMSGSAGTGALTCMSGQAKCAGPNNTTVCATTATDPNNCGVCGMVCGSGQQCTNGSCKCSSNLLACGTSCFDAMTDALHCGSCDTMCPAGTTCSTGKCTCSAPFVSCGTPATCVDPTSNAAFCGPAGMCGTACPTTTPFCSAGACAASCAAGSSECVAGSGSCINVMGNDPANCGSCGHACTTGQACSAGVCGCPTGQMACNGVCTDLQLDPNNCGACGTSCMGKSCAGGMCATGCTAPEVDCSGACKNTMTDAANCGACGTMCAAGQTCSGGMCGTTVGRPTGCPATAALISDFEEGPPAIVVNQAGRDGWWYVYADPSAGTQSPSVNTGAPIMAADSGDTAMCNKFALHSNATGHPSYVGFGATFHPTGTKMLPNEKGPVDLSMYTGISFKIKAGSGTAPPIWFEMVTKENQPGPSCKTGTDVCADAGGTATNGGVDAYNTRGALLSGITTTWQTMTIPFSTLGPRYLPGGAADGCSTATTKCEAPLFIATSALGLQFSLYDQFNTSGAYDLWVDDVTLTTGDAGIPTYTQEASGTHKFPQDAMMPNCTKPTGASGKQLIQAYLNWKKTFVVASGSNMRVQRPENSNDSVSEGIAYGMLIAVNFNDKALFDGLYGYWQANSTAGHLMTWQVPGGSGSATDADEDAAFALIQAGKQWGGTYASAAATMIGDIWNNDVKSGSPSSGSNYADLKAQNPSYFAPAYYHAFQAVDSGHGWDGVANNVRGLVAGSISGSNGLVPAWCTNNCTSAGSGGLNYTDETKYQYDSHRTPFRFGLDACWNANAQSKAYAAKTTAFFSGKATNGIGRILDIYGTDGSAPATPKYNSMSIIGTAGVGAMSSTNTAFIDQAWQFLIAGSYTQDPTFRAGSTAAYTYYNATVGLLTALAMSGNFGNW